MIDEFDEKLREEFPVLFERLQRKQFRDFVFYFEHEKGWHDLVRKLSILIKEIDTKNTIRATQVKEKFGALVFYVNHYEPETADIRDEIEAIIGKAYILSLHICETCGSVKGVGRVKINGSTIKTLCEECQGKYEKIEKLDREDYLKEWQ